MHAQKKYSDKDITNILQKENKFISDLFEISCFPAQVHQSIDDAYLKDDSETKKGNKPPAKRAKSMFELQERLRAITSKKKLTYKEKLQKKGLKNRMKKKNKKHERKINKAESSKEVKTEDDKPEVKSTTPTFNKDDKMIFSKIIFPSEAANAKKKSGEKNPKKILDNLIKQKHKLKTLVDDGEKVKAEEIKSKTVWKSALARAEGKKVKDDPILLKKSIEKKKQKQAKSKKKWEERLETVKKAKEDRQAKRTKNIDKRKKEKKLSKMKKAVKRGKIIPGL